MSNKTVDFSTAVSSGRRFRLVSDIDDNCPIGFWYEVQFNVIMALPSGCKDEVAEVTPRMVFGKFMLEELPEITITEADFDEAFDKVAISYPTMLRDRLKKQLFGGK